MTAGSLIRQVIEESGRTQVSWAGELHVSPKHLSQVIHGHTTFSVSFAVRFEEVSGMQAETLLHLQADHLVSRVRAARKVGK